MSFSTASLLLLIPFALILVWSVRASLAVRKNLKPFWSRSCTGRAWKQRFPTASAKQIRVFLHLFCNAFTFSRSRALHFLPEDRLTDIYRAQNPPEYGLPDALEFEDFAERLAEAYKLELQSVWRDDLTLGEVFDLTHRKT
jgi:hypothetical protein